MVKTVVAFDLYATHFGQEKAESIAAAWRKYQLEYTWRLNSMKQYKDFSYVTRSSLSHALAENEKSLSDDATEELMEAYDALSTFPDVAPTLQRLAKASDIQCVVFSNGTESMLTNSVHGSGELSPHSSTFEQIVSVDAVQCFKPAPEVYSYLAKCTGMTNQMDLLWLVSGNPFDVVGARTVGMQAAWVDRAGNGWQDSLGEKPTVIVRSLEQVAEAVRKQAQGKSG